MGTEQLWSQFFWLPNGTSYWFVLLIYLVCVYVFVIFPSYLFFSYLDRKLGADLQARVGPNRTGPIGFLQPLADVIKLLQKEGSSGAWPTNLVLLLIGGGALFTTVGLLPLGSLSPFVQVDTAVLLPLIAALVGAFSLVLAGFFGDTANQMIGGARFCAQSLSALLPAITTLLAVGIYVGGFRWSAFIEVQQGALFGWSIFSTPFHPLGFLVFTASGAMLFGSAPMDGWAVSPDLRGGILSVVSGRSLGLFRFFRFYGLWLWSLITVVVFLGAWKLPFGIREILAAESLFKTLLISELLIILMKTFSMMLIMSWISHVIPRLRVDQVTDTAWKILTPLALTTLIGITLWKGVQHW